MTSVVQSSHVETRCELHTCVCQCMLLKTGEPSISNAAHPQFPSSPNVLEEGAPSYRFSRITALEA